MTGCRISKIKPKNGGSEITILAPPMPRTSVMEHLQGLMQQEREGHIESIAYTVVYKGGKIDSGWSRIENLSALYGGVIALFHRLIGLQND